MYTMCKSVSYMQETCINVSRKKREIPYSTALNWVRCRLSFALLRASIMSITGARLFRQHSVTECPSACKRPPQLSLNQLSYSNKELVIWTLHTQGGWLATRSNSPGSAPYSIHVFLFFTISIYLSAFMRLCSHVSKVQ